MLIDITTSAAEMLINITTSAAEMLPATHLL
jgi:hypothetical protein